MKKTLLKGIGLKKEWTLGKEKNSVLKGISVEIFEGDFTVIMGSSGAGKSTLLYALSGMDGISGGKTEFSGKEISRLNDVQMAEIRAKEFGFVFQQTHLVSNLSLFENVVVAGYAAKKFKPAQVRQRAEKLLESMNVSGAKFRFPSQVSGGEAQRAAIARALINEPKIVFADEPTGALNKSMGDEVLSLLSKANEGGQTILMVTHDVRAAIRGNRILYLDDGKITDELVLPRYDKDGLSARESKLNRWLETLRW